MIRLRIILIGIVPPPVENCKVFGPHLAVNFVILRLAKTARFERFATARHIQMQRTMRVSRAAAMRAGEVRRPALRAKGGG